MPDQSHVKHVYLLDDNTGEIALTRRALASAWFSVHLEVVPSSDALIKLFSDSEFQSPDLILIDTGCPGDDSFRLIDWIRHNQDLLLTPIVMVASRGSNADVVRCYESGVSSYIHKSPDFTEYAIQLKEVCSYWLDLNVLPANQLSKSA